MRIVILFLFIMATGLASAQTEDIDLTRTGNVYAFTCQPTEPVDKLAQMCAVRTDLAGDPMELGCVPHNAIDSITWDVSVERTPHEDASIRCYAIDSEGNVSDISDNAGLADFTPNGKPFIRIHP